MFFKIVAKNRAVGNNTIFLQQFFRFRGGGGFPPAYALEHMLSFAALMKAPLGVRGVKKGRRLTIEKEQTLKNSRLLRNLGRNIAIHSL